MIVISKHLIDPKKWNKKSHLLYFYRWDDGDVYSLVTQDISQEAVPGTIYWTIEKKLPSVKNIGNEFDRVRVICRLPKKIKGTKDFKPEKVVGYVLCKGRWKKVPVKILPVKDEIFSRFGGLLETDALKDKKIALFGLGTVGGQVAVEAAKLSVGGMYLIDYDRFEVGNISRHVAGLQHVGRKKANVIEQLIREINPYATVKKYDDKVEFGNKENFRKIIKTVDIVLCSTDDQDSRKIINRMCVEENKICILAGAFRRAYGVQIFIVRPFISHCYQCFLMNLPKKDEDVENFSQQEAEDLSYTNQVVAIEPGLSNDIAPVNIMVIKLMLQELLKDKETTLRSLDEDLIANWYIWINRREKETPYEDLSPMGFNFDEFSILRWYGIKFERDPKCPVCGNYEESLALKYGIQEA